MRMEGTYLGAYGRLRVLRPEFLSSNFISSLEGKDGDDFVKALSSTSYKKEIDALSGLYKLPDLVEVVLNSHMMRMIHDALFALPPSARSVISAYMGRWDVENIETILSSKVLGYTLEHTEAFITTERAIPIGIFSGMIKREDYINIIAQKDIEGVVNYLVKFGYGRVLLKHMDEVKKDGDITGMVLDLDLYYYNSLFEAFRFIEGTEGRLLGYIRELIDVKNLLTVMKSLEFQNRDVKSYLIRGGKIPEQRLIEMANAKDIQSTKDFIPYKIDDAFEAYKRDPFATYFDVAMRREVYRKYLGSFERSMNIEFILGFIIRSEIERNELRAVWLSSYYKINRQRAEQMLVLKHLGA
jgi:V/A-type H+-transporting ATPase subunit C